MHCLPPHLQPVIFDAWFDRFLLKEVKLQRVLIPLSVDRGLQSILAIVCLAKAATLFLLDGPGTPCRHFVFRAHSRQTDVGKGVLDSYLRLYILFSLYKLLKVESLPRRSVRVPAERAIAL